MAADVSFPGFVPAGFRFRLPWVSFARPEAEALTAEAARRDLSPAEVVRGIVREWRERQGGAS